MRVHAWTKGIRGLVMALAALPGCYFAAHEVAGGIASATAFPTPPLEIHRDDPSKTDIDVATDGFFVIDSWGRAPELMTAQITIDGGVDVAGTLKAVGQYLTWEATTPLAVGTRFTATIADQSAISAARASFVVVGEPTPLTEASVSFGDWVNFSRGFGQSVTCMVSVDGTEQPAEVWPDHEQLMGNYPRWRTQGAIHGEVLWEATLDQTEAEKAVNPPNYSHVLSAAAPRELGLVLFPRNTTQYCLPLTVTDLRNGDVVHAKTCASPQSARSEGEYGLDDCIKSPNGENVPLSCGEIYEYVACYTTRQHRDPVTNDAAPSSGGCQLSSPLPRGNGIALVAAVAVLALGRRRRQRRLASTSTGSRTGKGDASAGTS